MSTVAAHVLRRLAGRRIPIVGVVLAVVAALGLVAGMTRRAGAASVLLSQGQPTTASSVESAALTRCQVRCWGPAAGRQPGAGTRSGAGQLRASALTAQRLALVSREGTTNEDDHHDDRTMVGVLALSAGLAACGSEAAPASPVAASASANREAAAVKIVRACEKKGNIYTHAGSKAICLRRLRRRHLKVGFR